MKRSSRCSPRGSRPSIELVLPRAVAAALVGALAAVFGVAAAAAHAPAAPAVRELLRLQGHKQAGSSCAGRSLQLSALGKSEEFCADEYRRLALATEKPVELAEQPSAIDLQGGRALLSRFAAARADQKITILGEWRPGRRDLFLIALDLCPEE